MSTKSVIWKYSEIQETNEEVALYAYFKKEDYISEVSIRKQGMRKEEKGRQERQI